MMRLSLKCVTVHAVDGDGYEFVLLDPVSGASVAIETDERDAFELGDWYSMVMTKSQRRRRRREPTDEGKASVPRPKKTKKPENAPAD